MGKTLALLLLAGAVRAQAIVRITAAGGPLCDCQGRVCWTCADEAAVLAKLEEGAPPCDKIDGLFCRSRALEPLAAPADDFEFENVDRAPARGVP